MGIKLLGVSIPLLVISIIAVIATAADETGKPLITKTCAGTEFPDVCTSRLALELSEPNVNDSAGLAYNLLQSASSFKPWSELSTCFHSYNTSVYQIKDHGLQSFDEGKYDKAYEAVDLLNKDALRCSTFEIPELDESNTMLYKFTTVVKTILQLLF
jgi:hypothetical protein